MTQQIQVFTHPTIGEIRGFIKDGEPWFLAGQVCRNLGIKDSAKAVRDIEQKYKNAGVKATTSSRTLVQTAGGRQQTVIIPEPMLYELIFNSRKAKAIEFRAWVTGEVLPALRKHGYYRMEGKLIRRQETDSIKNLVDYAIGQGSKNAGRYFTSISRLTNKLLGLEAGQRDSLDPDMLKRIATLEGVVDIAIQQGINKKLKYKDICKLLKSKAEIVAETLGI